MNKRILMFGDTDIEKCKVYYSECKIDTNNADIEKVLISNNVSLNKRSFKYFIGYKKIMKM